MIQLKVKVVFMGFEHKRINATTLRNFLRPFFSFSKLRHAGLGCFCRYSLPFESGFSLKQRSNLISDSSFLTNTSVFL